MKVVHRNIKRFTCFGEEMAPWRQVDSESGEVVWPCLQWTEDGAGDEPDPEVVLERCLGLVLGLAKVTDVDSLAGFGEMLAAFYSQLGPLVPQGSPLPLVLVRAYLDVLATLAVSLDSTQARKTGFPPPVIVATNHLDRLWSVWRDLSPEQAQTLQQWRQEPGASPAIAWYTPNSRPSGDRSVVSAWLKGGLAATTLSETLQELFVWWLLPQVEMGKDSLVVGEIAPNCLFAQATLLLYLKYASAAQTCACGCGQPVPPGKKYVNKDHRKRGDPRYRVLSRYRTRKSRGKVTEEQYAAMVSQTLLARDAGATTKEDFEAVVRKVLGSR